MSDELPEVQCRGCDAIFTIIWNRSLETEGGPQYCPFCADDSPFIPEEDIKRS
jgi:hypothetical protein